MKRIPKLLLITTILLVIVYILGPKPDKPTLDYSIPDLPENFNQLENYISEREDNTPFIRKTEKAEIVWHDPDSMYKTPWSIVFIHGFSATKEEGNPLHQNLAKRYGANLYLARLSEHGIAHEDAMLNIQPEEHLATAVEAIAIGKKIGEKTLVISSSTGGTVSVAVAANQPELVDALVMYSPNIDIYDKKSKLLTKPWGLHIARMIFGGKHRSYEADAYMKKHWTTRYRLEALLSLRNLVDHTMTTENFAKITQPYFIGYYYKNEEEQDDVISIPAIEDFHKKTSTSDELKEIMAFPDAGRHVICNDKLCPDYDNVYRQTIRYLEQTLGLQPM